MTLLLPVTLALLHLLLAERGDQVFGIPLASVSEIVIVSDTLMLGGRRSIELRGEAVALVDLADVLGATAPDLSSTAPALVLGSSGSKVALVCDAVLGELQAVVKTLGTLLSGVPGYLGGAILDDGRIALIVDPSFARRNHSSRRAAAVDQESSRPAPKILVVDDQFMVRELQRSILEAAGFRVCTAQHGVEALELLETEPDVGLVVTDIQMPTMDGLELVRAIRDRSAVRSLPVVVVTSLGSDEDRQRGADAGADAYIVKSDFDQESLLETVNRLVRA
jgi:two-component system chemotaxis sensor kinase CheA